MDRGTFNGTVVALGALGIVTQLTLDIEPAYEMSQHVHLSVPLDELQDRLDDVFSAGYSVSVFTNWYDGEASVWVKRRRDQPVVELTAGRNAQHKVHPVPGMSAEMCTEQLGVVGPWHERLPHFRHDSTARGGNELQSEIFLPRNVAEQAIAALREISSLFVPALLVSEMRTVRADDLWLSPAYHRDSVVIHFTWTSNESVMLPVLGAIEERLMPLESRPHWGKLTTVSPRQVISAYERASDFEQLMVDCDPTFKFRNEFELPSSRYLEERNREEADPRDYSMPSWGLAAGGPSRPCAHPATRGRVSPWRKRQMIQPTPIEVDLPVSDR